MLIQSNGCFFSATIRLVTLVFSHTKIVDRITWGEDVSEDWLDGLHARRNCHVVRTMCS